MINVMLVDDHDLVRKGIRRLLDDASGIKVVAESQLQYLNCTIDEYSRSISLMGVGIADCLAKAAPTTNQHET